MDREEIKETEEMMRITTGIAIKTIVRTLGDIELIEAMAKFNRNYYRALIAEEFSPEQAMQIVISAASSGYKPGNTK